MNRDVDELFEALERNTKAQEKVTAALQEVSNCLNDFVVTMESAEYMDDGADFEESELDRFSFKAPGAGNA